MMIAVHRSLGQGDSSPRLVFSALMISGLEPHGSLLEALPKSLAMDEHVKSMQVHLNVSHLSLMVRRRCRTNTRADSPRYIFLDKEGTDLFQLSGLDVTLQVQSGGELPPGFEADEEGLGPPSLCTQAYPLSPS